jgi:DNA repair protein RadC
MKDFEKNKGHRLRLRKRFMNAESRSLPEYEILEMVLFYAIPRADTKVIAKKLLEKFDSIAEILNAEAVDLKDIDGIGDGAIFLFKLLLDFYSRIFIPTENQRHFNVLSNWHAVLNYCRLTMGYKKKKEFFRVLYLNRKNCLLADEFHDDGTIDRVQVYPREIARKALKHDASAIILIHNHPSGDPKPSGDDITVTKSIIKALEPLDVVVHDHIIIAGFNHFSFRDNKLL